MEPVETIATGLRNPFHFPAFHDLPDYDAPFGPYYIEARGCLVKTAHWCFLGDIIEAHYFVRPRVHVRTHTGDEVTVHFLSAGTRAPDDISVGRHAGWPLSRAAVRLPKTNDGPKRGHSRRVPRRSLCLPHAGRDYERRPISCALRRRCASISNATAERGTVP